jgi:hypothetical protein
MKNSGNPVDFTRLAQSIGLIENLTFVSAPMERTFTEIRVPLYVREPGCWLSAPFGEGKTITMEYCARAIKAELPGLPVFVINEHVLPGNELKSFFYRALIESNHAKPDARSAETLRNRLAYYWVELCEASPLECVLLFLDEGQAMRITDLHLLKDLGNDMARMGGALHTFIFGESPKLKNQIISFKSNKPGGEFDRILGGHHLKLHTYENLADWESLFEQMDKQRFDQFNGKTVREFFFGHADISLFSLKSETDRFYKALLKIKSKSNATCNLRRIFVGIRQAMLMAASITLNPDVNKFIAFPDGIWEEQLRYSLIVE